MVHSGFMTEFHQAIGWFIQQSVDMQERIHGADNHIAGLDEDIAKLQDAMARLNEVTIPSLVHSLSSLLSLSLSSLSQENEELNAKILDLRRHLRTASTEISHQREILSAGTTTPAGLEVAKRTVLPGFDTSLYGDTPGLQSPKGTNNGGQGGGGIRRTNSSQSFSTMNSSPHYMRSKKSNRVGSNTGIGGGSNAFSLEELNDAIGSESKGGPTMTMTSSVALNNPHRGPLSLRAPVNWLHAFREDTQAAIDSGKCRLITLKETREFIERVYESKKIANEKSLQGVGNVPMETMEQHMFRLLEKKYGLRTLAVEHAAMYLQAIEFYSEHPDRGSSTVLGILTHAPYTGVPTGLVYAPGDNDVAVFQAIFRNEIEEDFHMIQRELVRAIRDLTQVTIMGRNTLKDSVTIGQLVDTKIQSGNVSEQEWTDLVNYLYTENDRNILCSLLRQAALLLIERDRESEGLPSTSQVAASVLPSQSILQGRKPTLARTNTAYTIGVPQVYHHTQEMYGTSGVLPYDKKDPRDNRRLGYSSATLQITAKDPSIKSRKEQLKLPFPIFLNLVLDFQLRTHRQYLLHFVKAFRDHDKDSDGVLTAGEFKDFVHYLKLHADHVLASTSNTGPIGVGTPLLPPAPPGNSGAPLQMHEQADEHEIQMVVALLRQLDPMQTDRVIFSAAVVCMQKLQDLTHGGALTSTQ